ncbi:hypothetical protein [Xanthobacter sp. KR7-225]|uniref:hypothetical protein n=1 Tax=Xanthobacter sp. KR7-225 TaxID=3156613 RepID=UPI0032B46458
MALIWATSIPARGAEVPANAYGERFNRAADLFGATVRLNAPQCGDRLCAFKGTGAVSANVAWEAGDARRRTVDSVFKIPAAQSDAGLARILLSLLAVFSPELPADAREAFAATLLRQLYADRVRSDGRLGGWDYVLRADGDQWRAIVRRPAGL